LRHIPELRPFEKGTQAILSQALDSWRQSAALLQLQRAQVVVQTIALLSQLFLGLEGLCHSCRGTETHFQRAGLVVCPQPAHTGYLHQLARLNSGTSVLKSLASLM
jgi:hypothetical protein